MSLLLRILLYAVCLYLVMIVYTGQKHSTARATLAAAARKTGKWLAWSAVGASVMLVLQLVMID
jgi:hypothetical protein